MRLLAVLNNSIKFSLIELPNTTSISDSVQAIMSEGEFVSENKIIDLEKSKLRSP